jgi:MFS family permease
MQVPTAAEGRPVAPSPDGGIEPHGALPEPGTAASAQPYPPSGAGWYCVFVLALAVMINFLDRGILTLLVQPIKADLGLSDMQISLVMGFAFTFFYAIFGLPVARLIDRGTRKYIFSAGLAIFSVMTLACGMASSFWHLFIARMGLGVGETTSGPSAYSLMSDYFPPERLARAISVMQVGFVAGTGGAMILGGWLIGAIGTDPGVSLPLIGPLRGWQLVLMLVSIPGFIVSALMLTVKEPPRRGMRQASAPIGEVFALVLRHRWVYLPLFAGMGLRSAQMFGTQGWNPAFYQRSFGWEMSQIGVVSGLSVFVSMPLGLILGNWLTEHLWKRGHKDAHVRTVLFATLISVPLGILYPLMPNAWAAVGCFLLASLTSIMVAAPENAAIQTVTPNRLRGQITFLFLFVMNVIGMGLGPVIVGALSQYVFGEANIRYALALMGVLMGLPALFAFWRGLVPYGRAVAAGGVEP